MTISVYLVINKTNGMEYVGITNETPHRRWKRHVAAAHRKVQDCIFYCAIRKYGEASFSIEQLASARTWDDACDTERMIIAQRHTFINDGNGYNMTRGGSGVLGRKRTEKEISAIRSIWLGKKLSIEHKAKISAGLLGYKHTEAAKINISRALMNRPVSLETRAKNSASNLGQQRSKETRARIAVTKLKVNLTVETLAKMRASHLGQTLSPETRAKMSAARMGNTNCLGRTLTQEHRDKIRIGNTGKKRPAAETRR